MKSMNPNQISLIETRHNCIDKVPVDIGVDIPKIRFGSRISMDVSHRDIVHGILRDSVGYGREGLGDVLMVRIGGVKVGIWSGAEGGIFGVGLFLIVGAGGVNRGHVVKDWP
jgi:hypothetical protein